MKKWICILLLGLIPLAEFAQLRPVNPTGRNLNRNVGMNAGRNLTGNGNLTGTGEDDPDRVGPERDSVKSQDVPHFHKTWQWRREGVYAEDIPQDTTIDKEHNYNDIFRRSIANTYLANFPSPYHSDIYIRREAEEEFYPLTNIRAYLFRVPDLLNYSTTTPYTQLTYKNGGGKGKNETLLNVQHTQNIRPWWNAGFRYNLISSDGRYMNQKSKAYNVSLFSNYQRDRWVVVFLINQNNGKFNENGGITDKKFIRDTSVNAENIPVNLSGISNSYRNFNFHTQAHYNIGRPKQTARSDTDTIVTYPAKAVVSITVEDNVRRFKEQSVRKDFFRHTFLDSAASADMQVNRIYALNGKFVVNEHPKYRYLPGIYAGIDIRHSKNTWRASADTVPYEWKDKFTNTWLTGGLFNVDTAALFNFDAALKLCVVGDYIGDFTVDGYLCQYLRKDRSAYVKVDATIESKTPNPFLNQYYGNHDQWDRGLDNVKRFRVAGRYVNSRLRTEVGVGWDNTIDYVYFDTTAMPTQSSQNLMVLTAWCRQHFKAGHFHFDETAYVQKSTKKEVLSLPAVAVYSHNYYENAFFSQVLKFAVGVDLFFNTEFYGDKYQPSTMQFYNQRQEKTGNYPKLDVFMDFGLKRAHIFLKYEHVNYHFSNGNYYSALSYPINPAVFKFGLGWNFYD